MKALFHTFAALTAMTICSKGADSKVFYLDHMPHNMNQLSNADSFSVECRNNATGVINHISVDVDTATVIVEIPGGAPVVNHNIRANLSFRQVQDRFGQLGMEFYVINVAWGDQAVLLLSGDRWIFRDEDRTLWTCAN